jgi:uncharacterized membrane protein
MDTHAVGDQRHGGFVAGLLATPVKAPDLDSLPLFTEPLWVVYPRPHAQRAGLIIDTDDLCNRNKRFLLSLNRPDNVVLSGKKVSGRRKEDRAMTKTMSFAAVHFTVAFTVGYLMSGSMLVSGAIALVEPAINTVAYHFHERAWRRLGMIERLPAGRVAQPM